MATDQGVTELATAILKKAMEGRSDHTPVVADEARIKVSEANRAVVAFVADLFEKKGTPEQEALKASLRAMLSTSKPGKRKAG